MRVCFTLIMLVFCGCENGTRYSKSTKRILANAPGLVCLGTPEKEVFSGNQRFIEETFIVFNSSSESIPLRTEYGCGCIKVEMNRKVIAPGEESEVRLSLDTSARLASTAWIVNELNAKDRVALTLRASQKFVEPLSIRFYPSQLTLKQKFGEAVTTSVYLTVCARTDWQEKLSEIKDNQFRLTTQTGIDASFVSSKCSEDVKLPKSVLGEYVKAIEFNGLSFEVQIVVQPLKSKSRHKMWVKCEVGDSVFSPALLPITVNPY